MYEIQNHRVLDLTSHPAPCPVKLGREPKWRHFDVLRRAIEQGYNQIKTFLRQITPKNTIYYLSEKCFDVVAI